MQNRALFSTNAPDRLADQIRADKGTGQKNSGIVVQGHRDITVKHGNQRSGTATARAVNVELTEEPTGADSRLTQPYPQTGGRQ